jgi:hypothetical protein
MYKTMEDLEERKDPEQPLLSSISAPMNLSNGTIISLQEYKPPEYEKCKSSFHRDLYVSMFIKEIKHFMTNIGTEIIEAQYPKTGVFDAADEAKRALKHLRDLLYGDPMRLSIVRCEYYGKMHPSHDQCMLYEELIKSCNLGFRIFIVRNFKRVKIGKYMEMRPICIMYTMHIPEHVHPIKIKNEIPKLYRCLVYVARKDIKDTPSKIQEKLRCDIVSDIGVRNAVQDGRLFQSDTCDMIYDLSEYYILGIYNVMNLVINGQFAIPKYSTYRQLLLSHKNWNERKK